MQLTTTDGHMFFEQSSMNFKDRRNFFSSNLTDRRCSSEPEDTVLKKQLPLPKNKFSSFFQRSI